ncbi:hypothetical protein [Pseudomonas sp. BBP2017]|uniref:hypothetical protein n=1 Tax=Pseudomonas sp. BBP2017 TaxID=2109731 RepID=UPI000D4EC1C6|nr:hypothetical protein [Pseudomonas sp. BBP2017]PSS57482.1 hypothetical protein C6382_08915 [Pseudomonas sp. BBP2017]
MHTQGFSSVLSGNCLLLLSTDLDERERHDAVDAQLFAWLNASAEFLLLGENRQWHGTYMDRHTGLGWVFNMSAEKIKLDKEPAPNTPLSIAWQGLGQIVPAQVRPALDNVLKMLHALPATHPALQALSSEALECVQGPGSTPVTRLALEVRVVLPGLRTVAGSVFVETNQAMDAKWMTQVLRVEDINRQVTRSFVGELFPGVFSGVRALLEKRLEALRSMYVMPVSIREGAA